MRAATASIPALLAVFARTAYSCVELQGIVAEGGQGVLDLSFLQSEGILTAPLAPINLFIDPSSSDVSEVVGGTARSLRMAGRRRVKAFYLARLLVFGSTSIPYIRISRRGIICSN